MPLTARTPTVRRLKPVPATAHHITAIAETCRADTPSNPWPSAWNLVGMRMTAGGCREAVPGQKLEASAAPFSGFNDDFHGCRLNEWTVVYERKLPRGGFDGAGGRSAHRASDPRQVREPARAETERRYARVHATPA